MKNNTIRYLAIGFGLSFLLLVVSTVASFVSINRLISSSADVNRANLIAVELEDILSNLKDAETGYRGFIITQDSNFLSPYRGSFQRTIRSFDTLKVLTNDNPVQQAYLNELNPLIDQRFQVIQQAMAKGLSKDSVKQSLYQGKKVMDQARQIVDSMEQEETRLLEEQSQTLEQYTAVTPPLVILAAVLSFFIILFAFVRIRNDLRKRETLQAELQQSAEVTRQRVSIISDLAAKISSGDYSIRVQEQEKDELGGLADALNQMAEELETNFSKLEAQAWLQKGIVKVNDELKGEKAPADLANSVLQGMVQHMKAQVGMVYLWNEQEGALEPAATYACHATPGQQLRIGEGLVGQVAQDKTPHLLRDVPAESLRVSSGLVDTPPRLLVLYPLVFNDEVKGVVELGLLQEPTLSCLEFMETASANTAIAINTAQNRLRLHELLQETQAQAEELQVQQDELQRSNVELEMQSQKLQASEEELRVQQEELLQTNQDLEEKAQLLEEQNQFIEQKSKELVLLNEEIEGKNKELEQASRYKSEFLANMSHELRTPLNSILLLAKLLAESKELDLGDDRYEYARVIHSSGMGLLELINEILDLSKIEAGQMQLYLEDVSFTEIHQDMAALFSPVAADKGLDLRFEISEELPKRLHTDKQRLEQVLKNLLSNALKFTENGHVTLKIAPVPGKPMVSFSVQDTGIGIPAEKQALVFEAFKQVDGSSRRKYTGTGLGLSISRELARLLGGEIELQSSEGKGSTFTILVPLACGQAPEEPQPEQDPVSIAAATREQIEATVRQPLKPAPRIVHVPDDREHLTSDDKAVLIIEDDITFVKALQPFVKEKGYKVLIANSGDEGLELALKYKPVGILLDIYLPVLDGWTVIERLKNNPATRHIPVHTMSSEEARMKSLSHGAIEFINKPIAEHQVDQVIQRMEAIGARQERRLLIIEENDKHARAIADYFRRNNIDSSTAFSQVEGLRALEQGAFDGVVLDMSVNEKTTFDVLSSIKQKKAYEKLPVIVYTGHNLTSEDEKRVNSFARTSIVKKANSYEKLLSEVSIFLHLVAGQQEERQPKQPNQQLLDDTLAGKHILLVDDDPRNIYSLTRVLEMQGAHVETAANGRQALDQLAQQTNVDAVLIDIMMPEMDGFETIRGIRSQDKFRNTPIIAVTAKTMPQDRQKCMEAGASDYITKPVDIEQLLSLLRVWLY